MKLAKRLNDIVEANKLVTPMENAHNIGSNLIRVYVDLLKDLKSEPRNSVVQSELSASLSDAKDVLAVIEGYSALAQITKKDQTIISNRIGNIIQSNKKVYPIISKTMPSLKDGIISAKQLITATKTGK